MEEEKFTYKIDTKESLSVDDFSQALQAINEEYKRYSCNQKELRISEIRKGSFEVEFLPVIIPSLFGAIETTNSIFDFCSHLNSIKDYILGKSINTEKPNEESIKNCVEISQPIINNGTINFITGNKKVVVIDNSDAKQVATLSKSVLKEIKSISGDKTLINIHKKVFFYWYQAGFDDKNLIKGIKGLLIQSNNRFQLR